MVHREQDETTRVRAGEPGGGLPFPWPGSSGRRSASASDSAIRLAATFEREMDGGRGFLWLPVALAIGVIVYFALPQEPWAPALGLLFAVLAAAAWRARTRSSGAASVRILAVLAAVSAGLLAAKVRTDVVAAPVFSRETTATVTGWIAAREEAAGGAVRIEVDVHDIAPLPGSNAPERVRITVRTRADALSFGDAIAVKARLRPPGGPVIPGGFDFARAAFYEGIGGVGFAYGGASTALDIGPPPLSIRLLKPLESLRDLIRRRIEAALPGDPGHIAVALVIGDKGGIAASTQEAMRASGLAHILAISGLHMALVAGSAFWVIRALLALFPALALRYPIKKWAAAGALLVATTYLGISGAGVATQRAFIMLAIMLVAVMIDRRAITLRNVALAALLIVLTTPESVLTASFQMSFAATVALVSGYEAISARRERSLALVDRGAPGPFARLGLYARGLFLTSLIAGLATAPFAAYHFQRVAPLTLIANLAAMPAVGLLVMPMALLGVLAMPFGLEGLPLAAMSIGLDWVVSIATQAAAWSEGFGGIRMVPAAAIALVVAGFLWLALWRESWRWFGVVPALAAIPIATFTPAPSILIDEGAKAVAFRGLDGRLHVLGGKGARFEIENWLRADGDTRPPDAADLAEGVACDPLGCIGQGQFGTTALVRRADAFAEDCLAANVLASSLPAPQGCSRNSLVVDRDRLRLLGAHALYRDHDAWRFETAYPEDRRPFMPQVDQRPR